MRTPLRRPLAVLLLVLATCVAVPMARAQQRPQPPPRGNPLWGFADLHAHPATFLAFGADDNGHDGVVYGSPGLVANDGELQNLLPCDGDKHAWSTDVVTDGTQVQAFTALDGSTGANHTTGGWPSFDGWPSARSLTHQQMHVDWLFRAWQGGLRLLVASATDNKLLAALWHNSWITPNSWDLSQQSDYDSAVRQLDYIVKMVQANPSWMGLARNAGQAEALIRRGKLAVVLGTEMDDLTTDQILQLHELYGVAVVNPIHLADNASFGGAAVYSNLFDTLNHEMYDAHYAVRYEPTIGYRLGAPLKMGDDPLLPIPPFGFKDYVTPSDSPQDACSEGLDFCHPGDTLTTDGQANAAGLNALGKAGLLRLWKAGIIVDLAHMSDLSQLDTLAAARRLAVPMPVIDSHTDLRAPLGGFGASAITERKLLPAHAQQIALLHGMIGLGTEGDIGAHTISREQNSPLVRLSNGGSFVYPLDNARLRLGIGTADDNLDDHSKVHATVTIGGVDFDAGFLQEPTHDSIEQDQMKELEELANHSVHWVTIELPPGTTASSVQKLRLDLVQSNPACSTDCDNWKVDRFEVYYVSRTAIARLFSAANLTAPYLHQFRGHPDDQGTPWWILELAPDGHQVVDVETVTGNDAVDDDKGWLQLRFSDSTTSTDIWDSRLSPTRGTFSGLYFERPYPLPLGKTVADIATVALGVAPGVQAGCNLSCDNWDLQSVRISQPDVLGTHVVVDRAASPAFRFTGTDPQRTLAVRLETDAPILPARLAPDVQWLQIAIQTETDDLRAGNQLTGILHVDGVTVPPFSLNQGAKWFDGTSHLTIVELPQPVKVSAIRSLEIVFSGPVTPDDWKIGSIEVQTLGTPIASWYQQYQATLALMNGSGVALGTDLNGLNPQVPFSEVPVSYPLAPPAPPTGYSALAAAQQAGTRTFDFRHEGISNVGQLPEFLQSVQNASGNATATLPLFRSAGDFVVMWQRVEAAASALP